MLCSDSSKLLSPVFTGSSTECHRAMEQTFSNFIVGVSNQFAYTAARAVAHQPAAALYNPLVIHSRSGLGKTHLLRALAHDLRQYKASWRLLSLSAEHFLHALRRALQEGQMDAFRAHYQQADVLLVDDIQSLAGRQHTQEIFFHTLNALFESGRQIVLASDSAPHTITPLDNRLRSRLVAGLVIDIQPPDLITRLAILQQKACDYGIALPESAAQALAGRIDSNIRDLETALVRLAAYASLQPHGSLNAAMVDLVLQHTVAEQAQEITLERILQTVAKHFRLKGHELLSLGRQKSLAFPRHITMFLCREFTQKSFPEIGHYFSGRAHTTILHACTKIAHLEETDEGIAHLLVELRQQLRTQPVEKCIKVFHTTHNPATCGQ